MSSLHLTPIRPAWRASMLCFCTEELGSESISNPSITAAISVGVVQAPSGPGPQVLHGSLQQELETSDNDVFNHVSNRCMLQELEGGLNEITPILGIKDHELNIACSTAFQCAANLSVGKYTKGSGALSAARAPRTFPPPIASLVSDPQIMRTCKFNGRFVLQRVSTMCNSPFCAIRENGRLRLIAVSSSSCGLDGASIADGCEEDASNYQEEYIDKQREKGQNAIELLEALLRSMSSTKPPFYNKQSAHTIFAIEPNTRGTEARTPLYNKQSAHTSFAIESNTKKGKMSSFSLCVPLRSSMKLVGPWDTATHDHCLPALRLLLLVAGAQRRRRMDSTSFTNGMWKKKPKGPYIAAQSANGNSINEHNIVIKRKAALHEASKGIKQGYAIISMKLGLIILALEISSQGTIMLAKGVYLPESASSNFPFNTFKPIDFNSHACTYGFTYTK